MRSSFSIVAGIAGVLALIALGGAPALAAEIGLEGIELRAGLVDLEGEGGSTIGFSGTADLGTLAPNFGLEAGIDFWTKSWGDTDIWDFSWTNIAFLGTVRYEFPTEGSFKPFAFGGLGFHLYSWSSEYKGPQGGIWDQYVDTDGSDLEFGFHIGAGAEMPLSDSMNFTARGGFNANGGADYLFIQAGVKFLMGE